MDDAGRRDHGTWCDDFRLDDERHDGRRIALASRPGSTPASAHVTASVTAAPR
jgi:hypothetical protein